MFTRIAQRLLAMAAGIWHDWETGVTSKRSLTAFDHTWQEGFLSLLDFLGRPSPGRLPTLAEQSLSLPRPGRGRSRDDHV